MKIYKDALIKFYSIFGESHAVLHYKAPVKVKGRFQMASWLQIDVQYTN